MNRRLRVVRGVAMTSCIYGVLDIVDRKPREGTEDETVAGESDRKEQKTAIGGEASKV